MKDEWVLITGANRGIGLCMTRQLAQMGAHVIMACRDVLKAVPVCERLQEEVPGSKLVVKQVDLASLDSIRNFAQDLLQKFPALNLLINNAGIFSMKREETKDGFEKTIGTNYLGPFLLTHLIRPILEKTPHARIINLSSNAHYYARLDLENLHLERGYHGFLAYAASKLAIVYFTQELSHRLEPSGVATVSAHPGHVATKMWEIWPERKRLQSIIGRILKRIMISPQEGAQTIVKIAASEDLMEVTGKYFSDGKLKPASRKCKDITMQRGLWQLSERLTGIRE
jgi:NAD(P)-dependent dehydrogenase (short-subunit alcohol dehydrogenase family)